MGTGQSQTIVPVLGEHTCDSDEFDGFDALSWTGAWPPSSTPGRRPRLGYASGRAGRQGYRELPPRRRPLRPPKRLKVAGL